MLEIMKEENKQMFEIMKLIQENKKLKLEKEARESNCLRVH